jgi:hypothetical protein
MYNIFRGKSSPKVFFKKLPKVTNCPIGENSPRLVTLALSPTHLCADGMLRILLLLLLLTMPDLPHTLGLPDQGSML